MCPRVHRESRKGANDAKRRPGCPHGDILRSPSRNAASDANWGLETIHQGRDRFVTVKDPPVQAPTRARCQAQKGVIHTWLFARDS